MCSAVSLRIRLNGMRSSPVAAEGKIYISSEEGKVTVLKAGAQWEVLQTNDLDEACYLGTRVIGLSQYWSTDEGRSGSGAVICTDVRTPGAHPKPGTIRTTVEFTDLVLRVGRDVLDPENRRRLAQFNLTHQDAAPAAPVLQASTGGKDG